MWALQKNGSYRRVNVARDTVREILGGLRGDENWADVARFLVAVRKCTFHHCITVPCFDIDQTPAAHGFHLLKEPINTPEIILPSPSSYSPQFVSLTHTLNQFLFIPCIALFFVSLLCESSPLQQNTRTRIHTHTYTKLCA